MNASTPAPLDLLTPEELGSAGIDRILCVVAHPDDMEYGASAAVAAWTRAGIRVSYLLLTAGEAGIRGMAPAEVAPLRAREQETACAHVGVAAADLVIADLPDGLLSHSPETRKVVARRIREFRPQAVLTSAWDLEVPWGLNHVDHRHAGLSTVDAIRDADNPWIFPELASEEGLAPWKAGTLLVTGAAAPTHLVPLDPEAVAAGVASLASHEAYLAALPDHPSPEAVVADSTAEAGAAAGLAYALAVRRIPM